jgi:tRNA dimethylallyltransferase
MVRVIRALEINQTTGLTVEEFNRKSKGEPSLYEPCIIGLCYENREILYDRINARVDAMLQKGWLKETENLLRKGIDRDATSMQAIGYKELVAHLAGNISLEETAEQIKQASRRYAKRQMTWFRRNEKIFWIKKIKCQIQCKKRLYVLNKQRYWNM